MARVGHRNVLSVYAFGEHEGTLGISAIGVFGQLGFLPNPTGVSMPLDAIRTLADRVLLVDDLVTCVVQVAGKVRDRLEVPPGEGDLVVGEVTAEREGRLGVDEHEPVVDEGS